MDNPILYAVLLGVLQGITEFLPVSSSAHLIVISWLMDGKPLPLALNLALHAGTLLAILLYFWRDWWSIATALFARVTTGKRSFAADTLLPGLIIGSIPAAVFGLLFDDKIEAVFHHPATVVLPMATIGWLLWYVDRKMPHEKTGLDLTIKDALLIGIGQACALIPGVSRSGSTLIAGRLRHINRGDAARFSFLLGAPVTGGAVLLHAKDLIQHITDPVFIVGFFCSLITGCFCISVLLRFLRKFGFAAFAIYRFVFAAAVLGMLLLS